MRNVGIGCALFGSSSGFKGEENMEIYGKTLYVSDLDGTLLNRKERLSSFTAKTLNGLIQAGMLFTYATARSLSSSSIVTKGLQVDFPVIVYNGAFIRSAATGKVLSSQAFSEKEQDLLFGLLEEKSVFPFAYKFLDGREQVHWMRECENEGSLRYLASRKNDPRMGEVPSLEKLRQGDVFYFTCIGEREELFPVYARKDEFPFARFIFQQEIYRPEYWLEIMPAQATKAHGVERLKKLLGCSRVVAFGDAVNDIPLFQAADEGYAVENAAPQLKEIATGIIPSNEEDGVARWLIRHSGFSPL